MLKQAGGANTCVKCFLEMYAPAETPKAFAVSKDGAYGGRWHNRRTHSEMRAGALESCRKKPMYRPENPCVVFFEDDRMVWKP
ncbi:MAG: hypothetical protein OEY85_03430 [Rhodospirillales bacterium]|nr:hypothetical protein [Rhodospirillales bacterium]